MVTQLSVRVENKRGALAEICSKLAEKAVNILGLMVPQQPGVAPVRLVVDNADAAKKVFSLLGLDCTEEPVLGAHLPNRPGSLGRLTRKLADHNLDILYAYGSMVKGEEEAMIIVATSDSAAAAKLIK
jgi:hypothetical protein